MLLCSDVISSEVIITYLKTILQWLSIILRRLQLEGRLLRHKI